MASFGYMTFIQIFLTPSVAFLYLLSIPSSPSEVVEEKKFIAASHACSVEDGTVIIVPAATGFEPSQDSRPCRRVVRGLVIRS